MAVGDQFQWSQWYKLYNAPITWVSTTTNPETNWFYNLYTKDFTEHPKKTNPYPDDM